MASSGSRVMEKPGQELLQQQQQALKCPRCDSSNTKFCYYNNYSLSQPRHFCKACKRYWTRGGTLRNVPVGGGCRKNKRVKRPTIDSTTPSPSPSPSSAPVSNSNPPSQSHLDNIVTSATSNHIINPLFYGLPSNFCDVMTTLQFPRFSSRVSTTSGYDLHPQLNALGLGFSSGEASDNGFASDNTLLSTTYSSIFASCSTSIPSTPVMSSLLSSTLLQQKFINGTGVKDGSGGNSFQGLSPLQDLQMQGNHSYEGGVNVLASKEVKVEGPNRLEWNGSASCQNQMEHMGTLSDPSLYWMGAWSDQHQPNIGPSVTSLI